MQEESKKIDPFNEVIGTGVLGRANDVLFENGHVVNALNIDVSSVASDGMPGQGLSPMVVTSNGISSFADRPDGTDWRSPEDETYFDIESYVDRLNGKTSALSGIFGEFWSQIFFKGIRDAETLKKDIEETAQMSGHIWGNAPRDWDELGLWRQFKTVASLAQTHDSRNSDRDVFYVDCKWNRNFESCYGCVK